MGVILLVEVVVGIQQQHGGRKEKGSVCSAVDRARAGRKCPRLRRFGNAFLDAVNVLSKRIVHTARIATAATYTRVLYFTQTSFAQHFPSIAYTSITFRRRCRSRRAVVIAVLEVFAAAIVRKYNFLFPFFFSPYVCY